MTSPGPIPIIAALDIQPTYSAREASALLGRSYSWLDPAVAQWPVRPARRHPRAAVTNAGRLPAAYYDDAARHRHSSYRQHWFSMEN